MLREHNRKHHELVKRMGPCDVELGREWHSKSSLRAIWSAHSVLWLHRHAIARRGRSGGGSAVRFGDTRPCEPYGMGALLGACKQKDNEWTGGVAQRQERATLVGGQDIMCVAKQTTPTTQTGQCGASLLMYVPKWSWSLRYGVIGCKQSGM